MIRKRRYLFIAVFCAAMLFSVHALAYHIFRTDDKVSYIQWSDQDDPLTPAFINRTFLADPDDGSGSGTISALLSNDLDDSVQAWSSSNTSDGTCNSGTDWPGTGLIDTTSLCLDWGPSDPGTDISCDPGPVDDCEDIFDLMDAFGTRNLSTQPVFLWDDNGSMLLTLGLDPGSVLGVAVPNQLLGIDSNNPIIKDGFLILNLDYSWGGSGADRRATLTHELGHLIGVAHPNLTRFAVGLEINLPTMYPFEFPTDDALARTLEDDDDAAVSTLYPYSPDFYDDLGTIRGVLTLNAKEKQRECISVAAVMYTLAPGGDYAIVGRLTGTSELATSVGEYVIEGVPEGNYYLLFQPLAGKEFSNSTSGDGGISIQRNIDTTCPNDCTFPIQWGSVEGGDLVTGAPIVSTLESDIAPNAFFIAAGDDVTLPNLNISDVECEDDDDNQYPLFAPLLQTGGGGCSLVGGNVGPEALILFLILFGPIVIIKLISIIRGRLI